MAHLWVHHDEHRWAVLPLEHEQSIELSSGRPRRFDPAADVGRDDVVMTHEPRAGRSEWVLVAGAASRVRVNGRPLGAGIRVLEDRDEIWIAGFGSTFLSTESPARVEPQPTGEADQRCPRCKLELAAGSPTVRCPGCGVRFHQSDDRPCWTYADTCNLCRYRTALDGSFRWTPERSE